jgi:hypothetical protein
MEVLCCFVGLGRGLCRGRLCEGGRVGRVSIRGLVV